MQTERVTHVLEAEKRYRKSCQSSAYWHWISLMLGIAAYLLAFFLGVLIILDDLKGKPTPPFLWIVRLVCIILSILFWLACKMKDRANKAARKTCMHFLQDLISTATIDEPSKTVMESFLAQYKKEFSDGH